ncbi:MAG: SDR family oxidoreductase [Candidatus Peribacteria bacterium]|nr:MAG: SDR family oxidoreductase [Candidatus Peribacteria bacterium]
MKYVIITGVSEGLGYEIARVFLEKGFQVVGLSRTKPDLDIIHIPTDFTKKESIEKSIEVIKEKYSQFSCVVCCAAVGYIESLDKDNYEHTDEMFQVNIIGQNHLLSGIADEMKQNISDLVFIGATIGYKGNTFMPMYSVTKWGVR